MWNPFNTNKKLLEYIDQNDDTNFIKCVSSYKKKGYLMPFLEQENYPIIFILIMKNKCHEGMKYLLDNGYSSHYKFQNKNTWDTGMKYDNITVLVLCVTCAIQHTQKNPYIASRLCNLSNILKTMSEFHSYNVCNEMIMTVKKCNIDFSQHINLIERYVTTYKSHKNYTGLVSNKIYMNLIQQFPSFLTEMLLYNIFSDDNFIKNIFPHNVNIITNLLEQIVTKFPNYSSFVNSDGDTFLMKFISLICNGKIKLTHEMISDILQKFVQYNFDIKYTNPISSHSIQDIIIDTRSLKQFYKIEHIKPLFTHDELFIESVYDNGAYEFDKLNQLDQLAHNPLDNTSLKFYCVNKMPACIHNSLNPIDNNIINLHKKKKFMYKYYTGTLLHHIYRAHNILHESYFTNFNINAIDSDGCTLLDMALQKNNGELLIFLLGKGAIFNRISTFYHSYAKLSMSPLTFACCYRSLHIAKILINASGVNIDLINPDGTTSLEAAIKLNLEEVSYELITAGADPYVIDDSGKSSVDYIENQSILKYIRTIEMVMVT